jgi:hypothetical protein
MKNFLTSYLREILAVGIVGVIIVSTFLLGSGFLRPTSAVAGASQNVSGWGWSDNIGWISFNSSSGGGPDHGVNIDMGTGDFSGYAWSDNIGWISFNPADLGGCPSAPCKANVNIGTGAVTGWARALTYGPGAGWISFSSAASGNTTINILNGAFGGWAWSDDFGWIDMSKVVGPTLFAPVAPAIIINAISPVSWGAPSTITWSTTGTAPITCTAAGGSAGWTANGNSVSGG